MRAFVVTLMLMGCGTEEPAQTGDSFLAFSSSFADFRGWASFHSDGPVDDGTLDPESLGARMLYINEPPPADSTEYPIGTIIVEARETGAQNIFAKVKRGGGYNRGGARDWEWFELVENPVTIVWRGLGPPNGESYGGDPNACNACHTACGAGHDFVCASALYF
ncbi:MAG TPA: hypothetical protein VIV40_43945 [Kofleriaceae bacterium]